MSSPGFTLCRAEFVLPLAAPDRSERIQDGYLLTHGEVIREVGRYSVDIGRRLVESCGEALSVYGLAPGARVDDGLLDLVAVRPVGIVGAAFLACRLFLGNLDRSGRVRRMRGARFEIERPAPGLIHTDGECHAAGTRIEVAVVPGSLRIVCPAVVPPSKGRGNSRASAASSRNERSSFALKI